VYHFSQIAAWNAKSIAMMNARLSFKGRIEREKWVSQAKALAKAASRE
jgi:NADH-quinone oxidoreductase subunit E